MDVLRGHVLAQAREAFAAATLARHRRRHRDLWRPCLRTLELLAVAIGKRARAFIPETERVRRVRAGDRARQLGGLQLAVAGELPGGEGVFGKVIEDEVAALRV